jgi:hypothetical protein
MSVVFLTQRVPALESAGVQRVALYAGLAALLLLYSFLLNLFRYISWFIGVTHVKEPRMAGIHSACCCEAHNKRSPSFALYSFDARIISSHNFS